MTTFHYSQPYIIISAFIVQDGKLLLIQENQPPDVGKWNLPGGKLDFGENPLDAVKREAYEESGLAFTPNVVLGINSLYRSDVPVGPKQLHVLRICFSGEATGTVTLEHGEPLDGVEEIAAYKWVPLQEVLEINDAELRYHDIKPLVQNWQTQKTLPLDAISHITQG